MGKPVVIEGSFVFERPTGVQRLAVEILLALDKLDGAGDLELLVPNGHEERIPELKNVRVTESGYQETKRDWIYQVPCKYARSSKKRLVSFANGYPCNRDSIVTIVDVRLREGLFGESKAWRVKSTFKGSVGANKAERIVTISEFTKERIAHFYHVAPDKVCVVPCGWEHYARFNADVRVFGRFPNLRRGEYFYTVGSLAPHKNYEWIVWAARHNPTQTFVVSGAVDPNAWDMDEHSLRQPNIVYTGYVTDTEMKALMQGSKAFLFPSLYEGFGIPPLEALSAGVDCIVSDIPVLREVYGSSVHYLDPTNPAVDVNELLATEVSSARKERVLENYTWTKTAERWHELLFAQS